MDEAEAVYADTPAMQLYTALARAAINGLVNDAVTEQQSLRLFEIGGGTGSLTKSLLPVLPHEFTQYWFTDLSEAFLRRAQRRWHRQYPFVNYCIFNAENNPSEQGFAANSFDAVIAVNVLHATRDLHETLTHVSSMLRPGKITCVTLPAVIT